MRTLLKNLVLLLRRSPETEYDRVVLVYGIRRWLHSRWTRLAMVVALFAVAGLTGAKWWIDRELECLAQNIYFEARGEPREGQLAVAHVVMNRVGDARFPGSACAVIRQIAEDGRTCQFSWYCDRRDDRPAHLRDWRTAQDLAVQVYWNWAGDPTGGALWYHATYVKPIWRVKLAKGPRIGEHIFYHDPPRAGT